MLVPALSQMSSDPTHTLKPWLTMVYHLGMRMWLPQGCVQPLRPAVPISLLFLTSRGYRVPSSYTCRYEDTYHPRVPRAQFLGCEVCEGTAGLGSHSTICNSLLRSTLAQDLLDSLKVKTKTVIITFPLVEAVVATCWLLGTFRCHGHK